MSASPPPHDAPRLQFRMTDLLAITLLVSAVCTIATYGYPVAAVVVGLTLLAVWIRQTRILGLIAAVFLLLVCLLTLPSPPTRAPSKQRTCRSGLQQIAMALQAYHDDYGRFPPATQHLEDSPHAASWRVLILPYLEQQTLYDSYAFDQPWDSPHNRRLAARYADLQVFTCPQSGVPGHTSYVAVVGEQTMWPAGLSVSRTELPPGADTVLVLEVVRSGIHWMQPADWRIEQLATRPAGTGPHAGGTHCVTVDGQVQLLSSELEPASLQSRLRRTSSDTQGASP